MWFIGLLIGLALGNIFGSGNGTLVGGLLGMAGGMIYNQQILNRKQLLEVRVAQLEKLVRQLSARIDGMNSSDQRSPIVMPKPLTSPTTQQHDAEISHASIPTEAPTAHPSIDPDNPFLKPALNTVHRQVDLPSKKQSYAAVETSGISLEKYQWLTAIFKGNILAKIGVIILFFGIASGLKLAIDVGLFPISVRLMLGVLLAILMSTFGYHRARQPEQRMFGLALQGGGLGILYLIVYFMLARYQIINESLAFVLFTLIGVSCMLMAAFQDGRSLAILGISGAFLSPVMASSSGGSQITLFSYFLLLNTFIISNNWFKGWRELNISGFIFTLVIGMNWAFRSYQPSDFPVSETFLILFFLLYSATPVLFNILSAPGRLSWGDGMLLYGTPLAAAMLQNHLLRGQDMTLSWNACAAGSYYLMLWWAIFSRPNKDTVWLEKSLLGIAIGFFTLAIPLAFDAQLTSAFWSLEGFAVLYLGVRQGRFLARLFGSALQVLAGIYFFDHRYELQHITPVFNDWYVGCLIVVVASIVSSLLLQGTEANSNSSEEPSSPDWGDTSLFARPFLYWGLIWWFGAGFSEIDDFALGTYKMAESLALCIFSFILFDWLGARKNWDAMRQPSALLLFAIICVSLEGHLKNGHALSGVMSLLIPVALLTQYWLLYRHERDSVSAGWAIRHAFGYWILIFLLGSELSWTSEQLVPGNTLWSWLSWGLSGGLGILAILHGDKLEKWPFSQHRLLYLNTLQAPVIVLLFAWLTYGNLTVSGDGSGLPYLPVLNPFDLICLLAMFAIHQLIRSLHSLVLFLLYGVAFLWISTEAARLAHHWGAVPFEWNTLFASSLLQASLSLLWTTIAMGIMVFASQRKQRMLWFNGFGLLSIVGIKLMVIDLSNKGTALWTISLIGISLLILAASYFSPAPPKNE